MKRVVLIKIVIGYDFLNISQVLCVVGSREDPGLRFTELLLESGHSRVCFLHGGVDVFRSLEGVLRVPDT